MTQPEPGIGAPVPAPDSAAPKPNFQTFKKRMVPLSKAPTATIQARGTMSFNKAAHVALGEPTAVELLYDPDQRIVGVRAVDPEVEHAYPIRAIGGGADNTYMVSGRAFTQYYEIDTEVARRRRVSMSDGVLCIDLNDPGIEVTGPRAKSRSKAPEESAETAG